MVLLSYDPLLLPCQSSQTAERIMFFINFVVSFMEHVVHTLEWGDIPLLNYIVYSL